MALACVTPRQTCQVSWNFRESSEMVHDLQVSRQSCKNSWNVGNLIDLLLFCNKACFWCESERCWSQGPEITGDRLKKFHMLNLAALS